MSEKQSHSRARVLNGSTTQLVLHCDRCTWFSLVSLPANAEELGNECAAFAYRHRDCTRKDHT